jgi:flagellum-specific peptidoglycan hydrolase FlgJ
MKYITQILLVLVVGIFSSFSIDSTDELAYNYIDSYRDLAIIEMHRSGIPSSIILAQGLHETNHGTSKLSINSNNHFGIKCKRYWAGKTFYHIDDDLDSNGDLIESCFRAYNSPLESYVDHSNFLSSSVNYKKLFLNSATDYKAWAYGLKECGYATDNSYAIKLIEKIEKYNLSQYDLWPKP